MIPLRSTERIFSRTVVTASLIALNTLIFLYQATLSPYELDAFVRQWGIVPDLMRGPGLITLLTSMFLHGGWLHLIGNMLFLWVFGRNLEDLIGSPSFLAFYLLAGIAAGMVQVMVNSNSRVPTIGASGAIAGVMGAYLVKFPRTRIVTLIFIFFFVTTAEIPAAFILLYWFAIQFFSGFGSLATTNYSGGGVAYFAHIGGFLVGMLLIRLFPAKKQRWRPWYEED
jgi:membrane associated rhomboid family serine protease